MEGLKRYILVFLLIMLVIGYANAESNTIIISRKNEIEEGLKNHAEENGYSAFVDYMEKDMSKEEYEVFTSILGEKYIDQGLHTLRYSSISGNCNYCYIDGVYTIPYNVPLTVKWAENIDIDIYNENFRCNRHYSVLDSSKEAYMLIENPSEGYQVVRVVPDNSDEESIDEEYTLIGFEYLYRMVEAKKQYGLAILLNNQTITDEFVKALYTNERDYESIWKYAEHLPDTDQAEVEKYNKDDYKSLSIETILINAPFVSKIYRYEDGVYAVNPEGNCYVKRFQNLEPIAEEEGIAHKYAIVDMTKDAYALLSKTSGFVLVHLKVA